MNIVLCGFMGSGKTVVGKELAKIMGRRFVDTDQLVEARSGMSIPAIFQVHGEDFSRAGACSLRRGGRDSQLRDLHGGGALTPLTRMSADPTHHRQDRAAGRVF